MFEGIETAVIKTYDTPTSNHIQLSIFNHGVNGIINCIQNISNKASVNILCLNFKSRQFNFIPLTLSTFHNLSKLQINYQPPKHEEN